MYIKIITRNILTFNIVNIFVLFAYNIKKGGLNMDKNFVSEASYKAWMYAKSTGNIGAWMLFKNIENPPKELIYQESNEREL